MAFLCFYYSPHAQRKLHLPISFTNGLWFRHNLKVSLHRKPEWIVVSVTPSGFNVPSTLASTATLSVKPAYWQASHSGLSIEQNFGSSATGAAANAPPAPTPFDTAFKAPAREVDFSADVAPNVRR
jgi:hypothetical protein